MLAATQLRMSGSERVKRVTRKFHIEVVQNSVEEMDKISNRELFCFWKCVKQ